ncbi:MAG: hypothetical protein ACI4Q5_03980 [Porcipelethomonas sp.]
MNESYRYLIKFLLVFLGIFALIFIVTLLTPKIAAVVDRIIAKIFRKNPERVDDDIYKVRSIYDAPPKDDNAEKTADENNSNDNGDVKNG